MTELYAIIVCFLAGLILMVTVSAALASDTRGEAIDHLQIDLRDNELRVEAHDAPLGEVLDAITEHLAIDIVGFQADRRRSVDFSVSARSSEHLVRSVLRYLGARNYACEYLQNQLIKVTVFPGDGSPAISAKQPSPSDTVKRVTVIEVIKVIEETQAASLDIKAGDIILKYDGVRIHTYDDLIDESTKDHGSRMIQMILLRKKRLVSVFLEGGYIGVRIRSRRIPAGAIPADLDRW
ncbi:MAG: hypothetical protein CR984_02210 [Proteobacteria bacterium]|nr:MAG: hypothetical protein CR984_02210 [Pseudomonadota bacterium]